jgi:hypothetical protein
VILVEVVLVVVVVAHFFLVGFVVPFTVFVRL